MLYVCFFVCGKRSTEILTVKRENLIGLPGGPLGKSDPDRLAHYYISQIGRILKICDSPNLFAGVDGCWKEKQARFLLYHLPNTIVDVPITANPYPWVNLELSKKESDSQFDSSIAAYAGYLRRRLIPKEGDLEVAV